MDIELPHASPAAAKLFACFSRFEFALKECGYIKADGYGGAEPDWDKFSKLDGLPAVLQQLRAKGTAAELLQHPPKRQVVDGVHWKWADAPPIVDAATFVRAVKRVRNNLFHGGKAGADPRDDQLCEDAVSCLVALLELDLDVRWAFLGQC